MSDDEESSEAFWDRIENPSYEDEHNEYGWDDDYVEPIYRPHICESGCMCWSPSYNGNLKDAPVYLNDGPGMYNYEYPSGRIKPPVQATNNINQENNDELLNALPSGGSYSIIPSQQSAKQQTVMSQYPSAQSIQSMKSYPQNVEIVLTGVPEGFPYTH